MRGKAVCRTKKLTDSTERKLYDTLPALLRVNSLHRAGRCGFDICAENIAGAGARGTYKLLRKSFYNLSIRPGYSAPEQYFSDRPQGAWTDVYKASALVFFIMTGKLPAAAFERKRGEPVFTEPVPERLSAVAGAAEAGLAPDISQREASLDALCEAIRSLPLDEEKPARDKKTRRAALIAAAAAALFFGAWAVSEINYAQAIKHTDDYDFYKAERSISGVPDFYRDAKRLRLYISAGVLQNEGDFERAESLFAAMDGYRDADLMVSETKYRYALRLLESGSTRQAKALFEELGDYGDARDMAKEAAYKEAVGLAKSGELLSARSIISAIHPYKDSKALISGLNAGIYEKAIEHYTKQNYSSAADYFALVPGYLQSDCFGVVCAALSRKKLERGRLEQLMACADEIDLSRIFMRDDVIGLFLEGTWKGAKGVTFIIEDDKSVTTNLQWKKGIYYYFSGAALYIRTNGNEDVKAFEFTYADKNTISVYCLKDGKTYKLSRER
ncbi:MAG: hypothetical protein WDA65_05365 [Christensenellales bacterium]